MKAADLKRAQRIVTELEADRAVMSRLAGETIRLTIGKGSEERLIELSPAYLAILADDVRKGFELRIADHETALRDMGVEF